MKYIIFSLGIALLAVMFAVQNSMVVPVSFLTFSFEASLVVVITLSAIFGALIIWPPTLFMQVRLHRKIAQLEEIQQPLENENKRLKEELLKLKKQPDTEATQTDS